MNYNDFLNLPEIKKRNLEPGDAGILIHEGDKIAENINIGKTRNEMNEYLKKLFLGLDEENIIEFINEAVKKNLNKKHLEDITTKNSQTGLKLESINTSAIRSKNTKSNSFTQKTPTLDKTNIEKSTNDENELEIE